MEFAGVNPLFAKLPAKIRRHFRHAPHVVVHKVNLDAFGNFPEQYILYFAPYDTVVDNKILEKNVFFRFFEFAFELREKYRSVFQIFRRRIIVYGQSRNRSLIIDRSDALSAASFKLFQHFALVIIFVV